MSWWNPFARRTAPVEVVEAKASVPPRVEAGGELPPALARIIRPEARLNWINASVRVYTPAYIEMVLRLGLTGDTQMQWQLFHWMEDTWPRLNKNLLELKRAVVAMDRSVTPHARRGQQPTPEAERRADLVHELLFDMQPEVASDENGFKQTVFDLLDGWGKGMSVLEIDWSHQDRDGLGSVLAPQCTRWVHPTFWGFSPTANKLGLRLGDPKIAVPSGALPLDGGLWEMPPDKFLVGICKARSSVVPAAALLRPLAFWWCAMNFTSEWLLNFAQIFGVPIRWAQYAQGISPEQIARINDMLANMGNAAWGSFPAGTTIELKEPSNTGANNPQAFVQDLSDRICDIMILGQTLTTDVGNSGSRALGDVHKSVRDQIIEAAGAWVDEILNQQLIPAICRLNFGDDRECPKLMSALRVSQDPKAMAERDVALLNAGVQMPKRWFHDRHDIPEPKPGEEVIEKAEEPMPGTGFQNPGGKRPKSGRPPAEARRAVTARDAQERLAERVAENVTGVAAEWLGGARPWFLQLVEAAESPNVADADFEALVARAARAVPEDLAPLLRPAAVAVALEEAMGASLVNGAVRGHLDRRVPQSEIGNRRSETGGAA